MLLIKRNKNYIFKIIIINHIPVLFSFGLIKIDILYVLYAWLIFVPLYYFFLIFFFKNLKEVAINDNGIYLNYSIFLKNHSLYFTFDKLKFSYKYFPASKGSQKLKFKINNINNENIFTLDGFVDGWDKMRIKLIINELEKRGVKIIYN